MNKILILVAALICVASIQAQTNTPPPPSFSAGLSIMADAVANATNWTVVAGIGHSLKGSRGLAFEDVAYNFNANVGVIVGFDQLWTKGSSQNNTVRGGVTLSVPIHPFKFIGSTRLTNIVATPFVSDCIAQGSGGNSVANIVASGINFDVYRFKNFEVVAGGLYENRMGQSKWDGSYLGVFIGLSRRF